MIGDKLTGEEAMDFLGKHPDNRVRSDIYLEMEYRIDAGVLKFRHEGAWSCSDGIRNGRNGRVFTITAEHPETFASQEDAAIFLTKNLGTVLRSGEGREARFYRMTKPGRLTRYMGCYFCFSPFEFDRSDLSFVVESEAPESYFKRVEQEAKKAREEAELAAKKERLDRIRRQLTPPDHRFTTGEDAKFFMEENVGTELSMEENVGTELSMEENVGTELSIDDLDQVSFYRCFQNLDGKKVIQYFYRKEMVWKSVSPYFLLPRGQYYFGRKDAITFHKDNAAQAQQKEELLSIPRIERELNSQFGSIGSKDADVYLRANPYKELCFPYHPKDIYFRYSSALDQIESICFADSGYYWKPDFLMSGFYTKPTTSVLELRVRHGEEKARKAREELEKVEAEKRAKSKAYVESLLTRTMADMGVAGGLKGTSYIYPWPPIFDLGVAQLGAVGGIERKPELNVALQSNECRPGTVWKFENNGAKFGVTIE